MHEELLKVVERNEGWFIEGSHPAGPFPTRERAFELAEGLAFAIGLTGAKTRISEERSWKSDPTG